MKNIPLYILEKWARREEQKIKELQQRLRLPIPQPQMPSEKEEDAPGPYEPLIIDMT